MGLLERQKTEGNASILNLNNICAESICALIDKDKNGPSGPNRMR